MKGRAVLVGNAGEHYVLAELLRREIVAGLTPRNAPHFDILATDGRRQVKIRVKTKSAGSDDWQFRMNERHEIYSEVGAKDFVVLVALREGDQAPGFYVVPTRRLVARARKQHLMWLRRKGGKRPKTPSSRHKAISESRWRTWLARYAGAWLRLKLKMR
jgi:hypothetical protein